jgi:hypothetical protein
MRRDDASHRLAIFHLHRINLDLLIISHWHLQVLSVAQKGRIWHLTLLNVMHFISLQSVLMNDLFLFTLVAKVAFFVGGTFGWQVVFRCDIVSDVVEAFFVFTIRVAVDQLLCFGLNLAHVYNYWKTKFIVFEFYDFL